MADSPGEASSLAERVREAIEDLRPQIQTHGGDIEFLGLDDGKAQVRLKGACTGCPHAAMTLQMGVERYLRAMVPEISGVVNVT
jgi:Fe-S cluster biogenesis protein NfuA